jgi:hypothetical protein
MRKLVLGVPKVCALFEATYFRSAQGRHVGGMKARPPLSLAGV